MKDRVTFSQMIKAEAQNLGFFACGISKARFLEEEAERFELWLRKGMHASMAYIENPREKRLDPCALVPGAKSVVSVLIGYEQVQVQADDTAPVVSKYAFGEDYHRVVKDKLLALLGFIQRESGQQVKGRAYTDSAPIAEKKWAELSGIAWRGKHSLMLTQSGSFFFIGELIIDLELDYDAPVTSQCGACMRCIEACPTGAIVEPYVLDTRKCISYYTIEHKGALPEHLKGQFRNRVFGCDICQDACPYNKISTGLSEERFRPRPDFIKLLKEDWHALSESRFNALFMNTALERTGFSGLKRNLDFLKS